MYIDRLRTTSRHNIYTYTERLVTEEIEMLKVDTVKRTFFFVIFSSFPLRNYGEHII
jgi:hypothetical protein